MTQPQHTPGPWRWQGEDYRGGWGWQILVGPEGQGILCGESAGLPYKHLQADCPIDPQYCKTGFLASAESAPGVHVRIADARLIAAAPEMLEALEAALITLWVAGMPATIKVVQDAIAKAKGEA